MKTQINNETVYMVDDDEIFLSIGKRILTRSVQGLNVVCFSNPFATIDSLCDIGNQKGGDWPSAIILDIHLPVMDGWEFLEELEKLVLKCNRPLEVWLITASVNPADYSKALSYPLVTRFFRKPFQVDRFDYVSQPASHKVMRSA